jgi:hypothetical protein
MRIDDHLAAGLCVALNEVALLGVEFVSDRSLVGVTVSDPSFP